MYNKFKGEKIISFHQSFNNSKATAAVLRKAREEMSNSSDIELFDSYHIAAAYTVQVLEAAKAIQSGVNYDDLIAMMEKNRQNTRHLGVIYDLFFLHRSGRLGLAKAILGKAMKIIPLLGSTEESGVLKSVGKVKTFIQANQKFIRIIEEDLKAKNSETLSAAITYCGSHEKEAQHLKGLIESRVESRGWNTSVEIHYTNHSNMPHQGPDFYDFGYIVI